MNDPVPAPLISVIVPTFNRANTLKHTLSAWGRQAADGPQFEVIVVDDGSTDETAEVLSSARSERFSLVGLRQENQGPALARNHGLAASMGDWVLFAGDDIEPAPDLLQKHLDAHRELRDDRWAVLGKVSWAPELEMTSTMRHVDGVGAQQFSYHYMNDGAEYDFRHFYTSNVSVSRRLLDEEFAGFSQDFPAAAFEDAEYSLRLSRRGMRIVYRASAQAWHHHAYDVRSFFKRQISCGHMAAILIRKWPKTRRIVGAREVWRRRLLERFNFGARRRHLQEVARRLESLEDRVLELAARHDRPPTSVVDPLFLALFRYGYLKGLAFTTVGEVVAGRCCAHWLTDLVGDGIAQSSHELEKQGLHAEAANLRSGLDLAST